jgi:hypothetical protein
VRQRHSLAPDHLTEAHAGAALVLVVMGVALFLISLGIIVSGLTAGNSFDPTSPPPNAADLGTAQIMLGAVVGILGVGMTAGSVLLLTGTTGARLPTAVVALVAAAGGVAAAVVLVLESPNDLILPIGLVIGSLVLAAAGIFLVRRPA